MRNFKKQRHFLIVLLAEPYYILYNDDDTGKNIKSHCHYKVLRQRYFCPDKTWKFFTLNDAL